MKEFLIRMAVGLGILAACVTLLGLFIWLFLALMLHHPGMFVTVVALVCAYGIGTLCREIQ